MSKKPSDSIVYWIRSDLRLSDNIALWEAAKSNKDLIVIYIKNFNKSFSKPGLAAESWINKSLQELSSRYKKLFNLNLQVYDGDYNSIFKSLAIFSAVLKSMFPFSFPFIFCFKRLKLKNRLFCFEVVAILTIDQCFNKKS